MQGDVGQGTALRKDRTGTSVQRRYYVGIASVLRRWICGLAQITGRLPVAAKFQVLRGIFGVAAAGMADQ
jgi:hypothetical protein